MRELIRTIAVVVLISVPFAGRVGAEVQSPKVGSAVYHALQSEPRVRVMVSFDVPRPDGVQKSTFLTSQAGQDELARTRAALLRSMSPSDFTLKRQFHFVDAVAVELDRSALDKLSWHPAVRRIDIDAPGRGMLEESIRITHVNFLQNADFTGAGTKVAVLDSGIDSDHPDLVGSVVAEQCFCSDNGNGCCPNGDETQSGAGSGEDDDGHGTETAGIIASKGNVAGIGLAPNTQLVSVKVMDENASFCCTSDIVAGLDWIAANQSDVDVVNASLGTNKLYTSSCDNADAFTLAMSSAVNNLRGLGIPTVAAAGSDGSGTSMSAPACIGNAYSVGATYDDDVGEHVESECTDTTTAPDQVICDSNSNNTTDLFAPGGIIISSDLGGGTDDSSGTSAAAAHVSACIALLLEAYPVASLFEIEDAIKTSPFTVTDPKNGLDFPRLDCLAAINDATETDIPSADGFESANTDAWSSTTEP